jgi:hypothetical protein
MEDAVIFNRRRLAPLELPTLEPFVRASAIEDCSVYWLGVSKFPIPPLQREWLLEFLKRLAVVFREHYEAREEWFLQFKALYPNLLNLFIERTSVYTPMTGMTLVPGTSPIGAPGFDEVKRAVEESSKKGNPVDVKQWMPDHAQWFVMKHPEAQREDFFGHGGMFSLYLKADPKTAELPQKLPRFITSHEAYTANADLQFTMLASLQDAFLAKSKLKFGEPFRKDPSYRGLLFVLPLFTSASLTEATPDVRADWFELFDGYCIESQQDRGLVLACKDPNFDEHLIQILERMRDDKFSYRE